MEELKSYFETVTPEQFKKDWEQAVGKLPKTIGPSFSDLLRDWEEFYGSVYEPSNGKKFISNIEAPEYIQELSF